MSVESVIKSTVQGQVKWFNETNNSMTHSLYFVGVPAPAYRKNLSEEANKLVLGVVSEFNDQLRQEAKN